jgi:hypothetical protein
MKHASTESRIDPNDQAVGNLAMYMTTISDAAFDLEHLCSWYDEDDLQFGGAPSKEQLMNISRRLQIAYKGQALLTGLDPCEKLDSTKARLQALRSDKWTN